MPMENVFTFLFPDIGEGIVEGEIISWLKNVGDAVQQDEPVVVVMTDKATVELPSPHPGILLKQYYRVGEKAIKDKPLYDIRVKGEVKAVLPESIPPQLAAAAPKKPKPEISKPAWRGRKTPGKALAIPKVRRLARDLDLDINELAGSGAGGRITMDDLRSASSAQKKPSIPQIRLEGDETQPLIGIRGMMARKMEAGKTDAAQFSYFEQVEATRLIQLRNNLKAKAEAEGIRLSFMPFFIRALSLTAKQYPIVNGSINMLDASIILHKQHNVGIAIASPQGLIVPVLKGVQDLSLTDIIHAYEDLKAKALSGKLSAEAMKDATITLSNFGVLSGDGLWATPMITPPEVAILALAKIRKEPVAKNHEVAVKEILPMSWSFDHRIIDGELAAAISHYFGTLLRDPALLL